MSLKQKWLEISQAFFKNLSKFQAIYISLLSIFLLYISLHAIPNKILDCCCYKPFEDDE
jgi:hypothetical protein